MFNNIVLNTLASDRFWGFKKKTKHQTPKRMWLCLGYLSSLVRVTDLVEVSKHAASLLVCTRKKFFCLGVQIFYE